MQQTEASLERDTDLIDDYIALLNRRASGPWPFAKLAALARLGLLRRRLATAVRRRVDPELERAEAAAVAETSSTWMRRFATSFWGSRALVALAVLGIWQLLLLATLILSTAYVNLTARPAVPETGYVPAITRNAILLLILFVFVFYVGMPLLSLLVLWGGRFFGSWRTAAPAALVVVLAAAGSTLATFYGLANPAAAPDSLHEFVETRSTVTSEASAYGAYQAWLDMNWLLKDPRLKADYEQYMRNGPGRWLTNRFDTTDAAAWADPQTLVHIGELVDQQHDQAKFREWLKDYVERNKIYSRDIDSAIDTLLGPGQHRFLSVWQAEPFLEERDVNRRRHYFGSVFTRIRTVGMIFFGAMILVALVLFAIGPAVLTAGWVARVARLERVAHATDRMRRRYYSVPEQRDLEAASPFEGGVDLLVRVHRGWVRLVLVVAIVAFGGVTLWLATRSAAARPVATQNALMHRFVALPMARPAAATAPLETTSSPLPVAAAGAPGGAGFAGGTGDPSVATDVDGDGRPDERAVSPIEAKLAAIQKQLDDSDYEVRKKFKTTAALLEAYRREIESLRTRNAQLEQRYTDLASTTGMLGGRVGAAEAQARSAAAAASAAESYAANVGTQVEALSATVDERAGALARRADALEQRDDELQSTVDAVATDLDEKTAELRARTERLGDRATDLAERTEQLASLQRTVYAALVDEFRRQIAAIERRSHSRLYRMFNKKEARAQLADLRRRIQLVRAQLQSTDDPDAPAIDRELVELQSSIGPVEERYK